MLKKLRRLGTLCLLIVIALAAKAEDFTATWDWGNSNPATLASVHIEGSEGTVASNVDGIEMKVNATNGKLKTNGDNVQFNTGTILQIPVKSAGDQVTVVAHPYNFNNIKVGGTIYSTQTVEYSATAADAKAGYVEIESTESPYLISITVVQKAASDSSAPVLYSWDQGTETGGKAEATDGASVGFKNLTYTVIRLNGKADYSTDFVTLTLDKPLKAGDKIKVTAYRNKNAADKNSGFKATFDKGGEVATSNGLYYVNLDTSDESAADQNRGSEPNTEEFEVPAEAEGSTVIKMTRAFTSTNLFITKLVIETEKPAESNDLLWDYTEAKPAENPDNGLYFGSSMDDGDTNMKMKGIKLNSSGFACFEKANVAGKLTLTFGNRKNSSAFEVNVWECTIADGVATKGELIGEIAIAESPGTGSLDIPASVTGIYIDRKTGSEGVLQKVVFKEDKARSFVDFEITNAQLSGEFDPSTLPAGVTFTGTQRNDTHGYGNVTITVPVDGTVKFTIGGCQYANPANCKVTNAAGEELATPNLKTATCYHQDGAAVTYFYIGEPTTLTFSNIAYLPYFKAEAAEVSEAVVTYKDQNGNELGKKTVYEGDALGEIPYTEADLTIAEGYKFRGWVYANGTKVKATDIVTGNVSVNASVTVIEAAPTVGSVQTYDLTQATFYPEDHELFSVTNGEYYNNHGFTFSEGGSFSVDVAGKAQIILTLCQYGNGTTITVTDANGNVIKDDVPAIAESDGGLASVQYDGEATTLTFTFAKQTYLHAVTVYNVSDFLEKDAASGYYIVPAGDAASLVMALNTASAEEGAKIFLPNGTYDLGEKVNTAVSGKNVSIIGQSAEKTIIVTAPPVALEGLGKADLLVNTGEGLYIQDVTLKNALDYYAAGSAGRAVTLHDKGTKTINKNVRHLSYQDTYYSHKVGGVYYFEGGEIHGTVDYMCGNGKVYFNEVSLINEKRSSATMTANSELYVFNNCIVENNADNYTFGRAWSDEPVCVFLNTTLNDPDKLDALRWNPSGINVDYKLAGEYGTKNAAGENITPADNYVTFKKKNTEMNTILDASALETYSIGNVLGDWATTAQNEAKQVAAPQDVVYEDGTVTWTAVDGASAYALFKNNEFVGITTDTSYDITINTTDMLAIRSANARGGFGEASVLPAYATVKMSKTGYATFYNSKNNYVMPLGMKAYVVTGATTEAITYQELTNVIPAGTAVMLESVIKEAGEYKLYSTETEATYEGINMLKGSDNDTMTFGDSDQCLFYKLAFGHSGTNLSNVFGWYWGANDGAAFQIEGHRAWLAIPKSVASARGYSLINGTTGINMVNTDVQNNDEYYNLQGQRVMTPTKGMYIHNNKKVIIK